MLVEINVLPRYAGRMVYADLNMLVQYNMLPEYAGGMVYAYLGMLVECNMLANMSLIICFQKICFTNEKLRFYKNMHSL